ncbi:MAG: stage V sporulation protein B [Ruminiclostridium sp.]|nr:stage V sporulation protein B [Ruminiclostridium sp.]
MRGRSFVSGAIILMAAGFVVRILGFVYRIYLSNLIGAEGMGLFQLIFPVYSLIILTLTSGISIGVSKMTAGELALGHNINIRRITKCALFIVIGGGLAVSAAMYLNLDIIAELIIKDRRTYSSLLLLIPCIPVIAAVSALKGYFYGIQRVVPTAVSQIAEQVVKISLVILLAGYFVNTGLEYACAVAIAGMALGEIANLAVLAVVYNRRRKQELKGVSRAGFIRKRRIIIDLVKTAIPVSANRFVISIMSVVENLLIPWMLVAGGLDYTSSMETYGKLSGMALPLIFFPSMVTSSLATTLVPAISEAVSLKNFKSVNYRISKSIQITFIMGFIFTAVFLIYPEEIGGVIYRKEKIGDMLYMLSFSCVFVYLQQTLTGVLNGLGRQGELLRNTMIGSVIRIGFVYFLIPVYGIQSYVWGLITSFAVTAVINMFTINKITGMPPDFKNWILKPGLVGVVMVFTGKYFYNFFDIFVLAGWMKILLALVFDIFAGLFLMVLAGVLEKNEILKLASLKNNKR